MVVISQWEANKLKSLIASTLSVVTLLAYLPRTSLSTRSLEDLKVYTVSPRSIIEMDRWVAPRSLVMQLNLFAGQLYLQDYDEYIRLCRYLGLLFTEKSSGDVAKSGFVGKRLGLWSVSSKRAQSRF